MAEFGFFATREESIALLAEVFGRGDVRAYVDTGPHEIPEAQPFAAMTDELRALLGQRIRVYLAGAYSTHPPLFERQPTGPHAGKYYLFQSGGGPLISLSLARLSTEGPLTLLPGTLSTQPLYQLEPGHWEKPTPALREAYADLVKRMKKHLQRYQGLWIGPQALKLLQSGQAQLPAGRQPAQAPRKSAGSSSTPPAPPLPRAAEPAR